MYILVVEDEPAQRNALARALEQKGHQVCWAATGEGALELLRTEPVDVMLLDLNLGPGVSGWEVARRKMLSPQTSHIPVIVITGEPIESVQAPPNVNPLAGALLVLAKPFDLDHLERALSLLETRSP